ncbi:MAG: sensor histidine kinase [Candidatus Electrothrix sp. AUS1_2]|nr:sensor histidine kinase [Candidatus Electrothrix sp. AUS1_2]
MESLREVKAVSDTMLRQINGMLTLARIDAGILSTSFQPIVLNRCLDTAVRLVMPLAKEHHIRIRRKEEAEATVLGDKDALTEALSNLLENAVFYNHPEGSVSVLLQLLGNQAVLIIEDTGIGIPEEELEQVFQKFYRSENVRTIKGTGLGLSITKAVVLGHQGNINVRNVETGGVCFTISLPLHEPERKNSSVAA